MGTVRVNRLLLLLLLLNCSFLGRRSRPSKNVAVAAYENYELLLRPKTFDPITQLIKMMNGSFSLCAVEKEPTINASVPFWKTLTTLFSFKIPKFFEA